MASAAYRIYVLEGGSSGTTTFGDFTQYMNFVSTDTSNSLIDLENVNSSTTCSGGSPCLVLHSGAKLRYKSHSFGGTGATNALLFFIDPDGKYGGSSTGLSKSVMMFLYYDQKLRTKGTIESNTCTSANCNNPLASDDPEYFSWD